MACELSVQRAVLRRCDVDDLSVLIAGGGTGGHLYPGIAVARELLARVPDAQVTFVGTAAGHRGARHPARRVSRWS